MSGITWVPVSLIGAFLVFGWLRLLYGASKKNRRIAELKGYADTYGDALERHHESRTSCEEALAPLREKNRALAAQVADRDITIRGLAEQNEVAIAAVEAMAVEDQTAGFAS